MYRKEGGEECMRRGEEGRREREGVCEKRKEEGERREMDEKKLRIYTYVISYIYITLYLLVLIPRRSSHKHVRC